MNLKRYPLTATEENEIVCGDLGISAEEWYTLLQSEGGREYREILVAFLRNEGQKASCEEVGFKYGIPTRYVTAKITAFGKWVQESLMRFRIIDKEGTDVYWLIPMEKGWEDMDGSFVWKMREDLIQAIQKVLMENLIDTFKSWEPFEGFDEEYKWELLEKTNGKDILSIIKCLKGVNIIDNVRVDNILHILCNTKEKELVGCVNRLFDESKELDTRVAAFKKEMRNICPPDKKVYPNDERTASALLFCKYPDKYTVYKDEIYQLICNYLGIAKKAPGHKLSHFQRIITSLSNEYGEVIRDILKSKVGHFSINPLNLGVQTLLWCEKDNISKALRKNRPSYWLAGHTFGAAGSQMERFKRDNVWESIHKDDSPSDQKLLTLVDKIQVDDILILKSSSTKGVKHDRPFIRVKGAGIVRSKISRSKTNDATICSCKVDYLPIEEKDFEGSQYGSYRLTLHKADARVIKVAEYINEFLNKDTMEVKQDNQYTEYIELLKANHNLILTGAPGTGKTYMARKIAEVMGAETKFVQFHPSYDYTDFVEGLRPVDGEHGQIGFERRDGIFKDFCKEAATNLLDSKKSAETLCEEISWRDRLDDFVREAIDTGHNYQTVNKSVFVITDVKKDYIIIHNAQNQKATDIAVNMNEVLELLVKNVELNAVKDIRIHFNHKFGTQADSYTFSIVQNLRNNKPQKPLISTKKIVRKPYVFIIDEINRGEVSKIFGELFYAIDPGYRGDTTNKVQSQYQNLVPEGDLFADGFYVPENLYILATMNDIDRSVESMDFAIRRRFTWQEVTPGDTEVMLDILPCASVAKATMHALNKAIAETEGLGDPYMVGPAYFLRLADMNMDFQRLWDLSIRPLLKEYLRGFRKGSEILDGFRQVYFGLSLPKEV